MAETKTKKSNKKKTKWIVLAIVVLLIVALATVMTVSGKHRSTPDQLQTY